jgi:hypothetical protein
MVQEMKYEITYLDQCELIRLLPVEADTEEQAQALVEELVPEFVLIGVKAA